MVRAYFLMKVQSLKEQLQYPANFLLNIFGVSLTGFAEVLAIFLLTSAFTTIGGWNFWQVGLMAGLWRLAHSLHQALFLGIWEHHWLVRDGEYDRILTRPAHPLLQILASGFHLEAVGELLPAVTLLIFCAPHVQVPWNFANILFLGLAVLSGALIEAAVYLFFATFDFWFPETGKLWIASAFLFPATRYPLHIYGRVFASFMTYLFPFAFIAYYPTLHFLQITPQFGAKFFPYISPLVAGISVLIAFGFWSIGLRHYQSTGT